MGQSLSVTKHNNCPDCLYMETAGNPKFRSSETAARQVELYLTINFNEQWEELPGGYVKFGLRGGELRLSLKRGVIPYQSRSLAGRLVLDIEKERQSQSSSSVQRHRQASVEASVKDKLEQTAKISDMSKVENISSQSNKFTVTSCQITTKGTPTDPAWVFEVQTDDPILKGLLSGERLATMSLSGSTWEIKAVFEVLTLKDVIITEADGPWLRNASPEKRTSLELGLAKLFLKSKLRPYISQMELRYG